jgi:copper chaperone CopZ
MHVTAPATSHTRGHARPHPVGCAVSTVALLVPGMTCPHCVRKVTAALRDVAGVALVQADASTTMVVLQGDAAVPEVLAAVDGAGFPGTVVPPASEDSETGRDASAP